MYSGKNPIIIMGGTFGIPSWSYRYKDREKVLNLEIFLGANGVPQEEIKRMHDMTQSDDDEISNLGYKLMLDEIDRITKKKKTKNI